MPRANERQQNPAAPAANFQQGRPTTGDGGQIERYIAAVICYIGVVEFSEPGICSLGIHELIT